MFTIIIDYIAGIYIERYTGQKRKLILVISLVSNIGILAIFKYYNFFIDNYNGLIHTLNIGSPSLSYWNILLPIGLSFHTFQAMSYTVEVYYGNQKAEKHFGIYALYVMFYPQLVAGPIERPQNILHQYKEPKKFDFTLFKSGLRLMLWGLFKKTVIADRLAPIVNEVYNNVDSYQGMGIIIATVLFAIQIYCDFSGYSDIALGSARSMGFTLMRNFNMPYFSTSVAEFWRRWHISLNQWFRDYLYIPLGGSKKGKARWALNLFIVFMISGLWHGAAWTYVFWGGFLGLALIFESITLNFRLALEKINKTIFVVLSYIATMSVIVFSWLIFRSKDLEALLISIKKVFSFSEHYFSISRQNLTGTAYLGQPLWNIVLSFFLIALLLFLEHMHRKKNLIALLDVRMSRSQRWVVYYGLILSVLLLGNFKNAEFIYFQF